MLIRFFNSKILAGLILLCGLAFAGLEVFHSFDLRATMLPKSDAPSYVTDALFFHHHILDKGFFFFFFHDLLNNTYWKATLTPFLLLPALLISGGKVQSSIVATNLGLLFLCAAPVFLLSRRFTSGLVASFITVVILSCTWLFSDATNFLNNLPLDLGVFLGLFLWSKRPLSISFFLALAFCFCIRPVESMFFWSPILFYEYAKQRKEGTLSWEQVRFLLFLFIAELLSFVVLAKAPDCGANCRLAIWFIGVALGVFSLYRLRDRSKVQGGVLFVTLTWAWFFTNAKGLVDWIFATTIGSLAIRQGPLNNFGILERINDLVRCSGRLPFVILPIAGIYLWRTKSALAKPFIVLLISISLFPFLSIFSATHYPIYFHLNFILSFFLTVSFLFTFVDRAILNRTLCFIVLLCCTVLMNFCSERAEPRKIGPVELPPRLFGNGGPFWVHPSDNIVDQVLGRIGVVPAGKRISVLLSYDEVWDNMDVGQLQYRALEKRLPYFFSELVHKFNPAEEKLSQIPTFAEYLLVGPMDAQGEEVWKNLEDARAVYHLILETCRAKSDNCPLEASEPIAKFAVDYHGEPKEFSLFKLKNTLNP